MGALRNCDWLENNPDSIKNVRKEPLAKCLSKAEALMEREPVLLELEGNLVFVGNFGGNCFCTLLKLCYPTLEIVQGERNRARHTASHSLLKTRSILGIECSGVIVNLTYSHD